MPTAFAITSEYTALGGTDYSSYIKSSVLTVDVAVLDKTNMASGGWVENIAGLKSGTLAITFNDSVTVSEIDSVLWGLLATVPTFEVRGTSAAVGTSNPKYTGSLLVNQWTLGGGVGELAAKTLTFPTSGAITRATS